MASSASSKALVKRNSDTALMPPPPPPKRIKRPAIILDEDEYTGALSHIIARDFFPGLLETQAQQEYLDAVESQDRRWILEAGRKLNEVSTSAPECRKLRKNGDNIITNPSARQAGTTPRGWIGATPASGSITPLVFDAERRELPIDINMSLTAFTAKYTSEDNESFNQLLDNQNLKRQDKNAWLWTGNKIPSGREIAHRERESKLITATETNSDSLSKTSQPVLHTSLADHRKAMPDSHRNRPKNGLMFLPDSIEDEVMTIAQTAEVDSTAGPKILVHHNTRFPLKVEDRQRVPPSPSMSAIDAAIAGVPRKSSSELGYNGNETPRVNGYAYVDEAPQNPRSSPEEDILDTSKLLARLGSSDSMSRHFKIGERSKREELHYRLVAKTASQNRMLGRAQSSRSGVDNSRQTKTSMFHTETRRKRAELTPAAQKLWERVGTPSTRGAFDDNDKRGGRAPFGTPLRVKKPR